MEARNPKYNQFGTIDLEFNHPKHGWIPFTTSTDEGEYGQALHAAALAGEFGGIAAYIPPTPPTAAEILAQKRAAASLSRKDFFQALIVAGLYEQVRALETDLTVPLTVRVDLIEATSFDRMYPSLVSMASSMGVTDIQLDVIFGIA